MFESKAGVLFIGGLGFFVLAFIANGAVPMLMYRDMPEQTVHEVVNPNVMYQFEDLNRRFPEAFKKYVGDAAAEKWDDKQWNEHCAQLLKEGRDIYVGEGCWHCHSQFVRFRMSRSATVPSPRRRSIRMSCNDRSCSARVASVPICRAKGAVVQATGMPSIFSIPRCSRPTRRCRATLGSSTKGTPANRIAADWRS